jgi:glycosyltransferase involved in cell wall biosynthesis
MAPPAQPSAERPSISVIIPAYNRLQFLSAAVDSVFAQTWSDLELLIVDDGSEPQTRAYLRVLAERARVRIILLSHTGIPAKVRNAGLREARGEFVAFLDSDDVWDPRKLQLQLTTLQQSGGCQWSYTGFANVDANGQRLPAQPRWTGHSGEVFERILRGEVPLRTPAVMATRKLLIEAGMFDESIRSAEDYDLWLRLALRSKVAVNADILVNIRMHREHHSADWVQAYIGQDRTFTKLQAVVAGRRKVLLRRERARNALRLAREHAVLRHRAATLRALGSSMAFSWRYVEWWGRAASVTVRVLTPRAIVGMYERFRWGGAA